MSAAMQSYKYFIIGHIGSYGYGFGMYASMQTCEDQAIVKAAAANSETWPKKRLTLLIPLSFYAPSSFGTNKHSTDHIGRLVLSNILWWLN